MGSPAGTSWLITRATRYAANCTGPCRPGELVAPDLTEAQLIVPLVAPGLEFLPRMDQFDLSFAKWFGLGGSRRFQFQLDVFNVFNANTVLGVQSVNYTTPAYNQPNAILNGRTFRHRHAAPLVGRKAACPACDTEERRRRVIPGVARAGPSRVF